MPQIDDIRGSRRRKEADLITWSSGPSPYVGGYLRDEVLTVCDWGAHPISSVSVYVL
jgi:hypothetical protein